MMNKIKIADEVIEENFYKLMNLCKALRDVDIEANLSIYEDGDMILDFSLPNCNNGNYEPCAVEFFADDIEFSSYVAPKTDNENALRELKEAISKLENN